jgi:hypothetical protein
MDILNSPLTTVEYDLRNARLFAELVDDRPSLVERLRRKVDGRGYCATFPVSLSHVN